MGLRIISEEAKAASQARRNGQDAECCEQMPIGGLLDRC